ncbi:response regulator [Phreatobacter oligotrophus]|uniref:response regulator n=1 Tax=Phreatobacter oligotrophus TaxID=1122261 RepID=UPI00235280D4|nr:response regulator [Phreatobacter oligotrophus]MBX9989201.1 response regulator [Phreatobacter oligotrophus]
MAKPNRSMLLVDDDPNELFFLRNAFAATGGAVDIRHAESGEVALAEIARESPDLVLLDLSMAGMDGFDVLQRLRADEATRTLPTLIFSSSDRDEDIRRSYREHANAYLVKPRSSDGYRDLAKNLEGFWYDTARLP